MGTPEDRFRLRVLAQPRGAFWLTPKPRSAPAVRPRLPGLRRA